MLKRAFLTAVFVGTSTLSLPAVAQAQQVNFDEFTSPPVTCCYGNPVTGPLVYPQVTIEDGAGAGTVMNGIGWNNEQTSGNNLFGTESGSMAFNFTNPVDGLVFDLINGTYGTSFVVDLYNSSDTLIDTQTVLLAGFTAPGSVGHVSFGDAGISSARISGNDDFAVDTILFNVASVPEPSTWAMMLLGFGAIGFAMRKRHSQSIPSVA